MKLFQRIIVFLTLIFVFVLVYSPHVNYKLPLHIDEWHHLTEAYKLREGEYTGGSIGYRFGFHFLLAGLSFIFDLSKIYFILPAIFASISALTIFWVSLKKTENFLISFFSMIFFASIKSNVNLGGLWFFTPLTLAIPLIYLYFYFFTEGIDKANKKFVYMSLIIMIALMLIHPISVLFSLPILIAYCLINYKNAILIKKEFFLFLVLPLIGAIIFSFFNNIALNNLITSGVSALIFKLGWSALEINNSFIEVYSPIGIFLAIIGSFTILLQKEIKKYSIFLIWPIWLLIELFIFSYFKISFLSPVQRNFYYLAISLPFLSAFGLFGILTALKKLANILKLQKSTKPIKYFLIFFVIMLTFKAYFIIPPQIQIYHLISYEDYESIKFLEDLPKQKVIAPAEISSTIYPLTGQIPIAALYFYGNREILDDFFEKIDCKEKEEVINKNKIGYVISKNIIDCGWKIMAKEDNIVIYQTRYSTTQTN